MNVTLTPGGDRRLRLPSAPSAACGPSHDSEPVGNDTFLFFFVLKCFFLEYVAVPVWQNNVRNFGFLRFRHKEGVFSGRLRVTSLL